MDVFAAYLAAIADPQQRSRMEQVLAWVGKTFPQLAPRIAWNQPMFTDHGTFIIGFSVARRHMAVAPEKAAIARFAAEIAQAGYDQTALLLRIGWDKPLDFALLEKIIAFNCADKADTSTFWRK